MLVNYIKDKLEDIDNPFKEVSFSVGPAVVRAFNQMVKADEQRAKETFPDLYRKWERGEKLYNKGGTVMKDQMEMAFMQEGGLRDDGMDVDPVSGNEIPPGSMASEVRDDIPAQLSEGEYVVPADVVQYFGVKFFEDLRMEAKRGLADMESNGRIGGEPIDMPMDMPMNQGGMMQTKEQTVPTDTGVAYNVGGMTSNLYNNPTRMDQQVNTVSSDMGNNPQGMDMQNRTQAMMTPEQMDQVNPPPPPRGFNPGGLTGNEAAAYNYITSPTIPNPMYQTPGASYMYAAPPQLTTTGVDSSIPSVENCAKMGMDYDPVAKVCIPKATAQTPQQGGGSDDDGDPFANMPKPDPDAWMEDYDYTGDLSNLFDQTKDALSSESFLPGPLGTFEKGTKLAHSASHIILLQAEGKTAEADILIKQWEKARTGGLKLTPFEFINGDRFAIQAAGEHGIKLDRDMKHWKDGKPIFRNDKDYERYLSKYEVSVRERRKLAAAKKAEISKEQQTKFEQKNKAAQEAAQKIISSGSRDDDGGKTALERHQEIMSAAKKSGASAGQAGSTAAKVITKDVSKKDKEGSAALDKSYGITGLKKGGLMKKKKK